MLDLNEFLALSNIPPHTSREWLEGAEMAVDFIIRQADSDEIILYSCLEHLWILSALAPLAKLQDCNLDKLQAVHFDAYSSCGIEYTPGGDGAAYVGKPFEGSELFENGEQLVFRREFYGVERTTRSEISQQLIQTYGNDSRKNGPFCS